MYNRIPRIQIIGNKPDQEAVLNVLTPFTQITTTSMVNDNADLIILAMGPVDASNKLWYNFACSQGLFKNVLGVINAPTSDPHVVARLYDEYQILGYGYDTATPELRDRIADIIASLPPEM